MNRYLFLSILFAMMGLLSLAGCSSLKSGKGGKAQGIQKGQASWYGGKFHGRKTASGEVYDMNQMTAAHKTLPFGTIVRVKNLKNGKTVQVRINDRGPFVKGRIIDLSQAAAIKIDMTRDGVVPVEVVVLR